MNKYVLIKYFLNTLMINLTKKLGNALINKMVFYIKKNFINLKVELYMKEIGKEI